MESLRNICVGGGEACLVSAPCHCCCGTRNHRLIMLPRQLPSALLLREEMSVSLSHLTPRCSWSSSRDTTSLLEPETLQVAAIESLLPPAPCCVDPEPPEFTVPPSQHHAVWVLSPQSSHPSRPQAPRCVGAETPEFTVPPPQHHAVWTLSLQSLLGPLGSGPSWPPAL